MEVKGIRWVGVHTEAAGRMQAFAADVLGLRTASQVGEEFVEMVLADGTKFELFGRSADRPWLFDASPVVVGFLVEDIRAAREELEGVPGVELLGELREMPDGYGWQHFRAPDGHVYELVADPSAGAYTADPSGPESA